MNDKEMLELAARAAGVELCQGRNVAGMHPLMDFRSAPFWDPLHNDGDALRLAVKLNALIDINKGKSACVLLGPETEDEKHGNDPYAATRRAIVRAAAAIGAKL